MYLSTRYYILDKDLKTKAMNNKRIHQLTKTEKSILTQIHLQGFWGKSGSLTVKDRRKYIYGLIEKGAMTKDLVVSKWALEEIKK